MKTIQLATLGIIPATLFIAACGDDVTKVTKIEETSGMEIVASVDSLGKCGSENAGKTVFVSGENAAYICADSAWKNVSQAKKASCSAEALSDSSGFKIVCDGDSVGVVKNGEDGKAGEKGDDGEGCDISDGGGGTVSVVCGNASTTLYKAFCGGKVYDPDSNFCAADSLVPLCGGESYDLDSSFCLDGKVYKNKTLVWSLMNPDIEYGVFVDKRDSQVYRSVKIGEQVWMAENLNYAYNQKTSSLDSSSFCYNNELDSCAKYGRLYLWSAAMDSATVFSEAGKDCGYGKTCASTGASTSVRGVCPRGWHLPSEAEFEALVDIGGGYKVAGGLLKSVVGWKNGSDFFGFSALPGGEYGNGEFFSAGDNATFWSASEDSDNSSCYMRLYHDSEYGSLFNNFKYYGFSVRCVKD